MRPSARFLWLLAAWLAMAVAAAAWPPLQTPWAAIGVGLALALLVDWVCVRRQPAPGIARDTSHTHPVGVWRPVTMTVANDGDAPLRLTVFDHYPRDCDLCELPLHLTVAPHTRVESGYQLRFTRRGEHRFSGVECLVTAPWGLVRQRVFLPETLTVRVYPNFAAVAKYALLATDHRLSQIGVRQRRRRGQGMDFHQLREYREGDGLRQVDWKASARLRKLISREYQDERDQQIMFLLDCGNRMRAKDGPLSHFDEALNAMLLLAHVALKQGDAVGCMSFGHDARLIPARKGHAALSRMMERLIDLEPGHNAPDYGGAALQLARTVDKRSLVLILTNLRDEDQDELVGAVQVLRKRHLVLIASLRETAVEQLAEREVADFDSALTLAAARHYFNARSAALETLRRSGAQVLDVRPEALPVALVNRYLDIKRSGAL